MITNIKDKVVLITGASSGIGEATAIALAKEGAKLVLGARSEDRLESIAKKIKDDGSEVDFLQTDVTKNEDLKNLVEVAIRKFGKLDVLVNNAGVSQISRYDVTYRTQ